MKCLIHLIDKDCGKLIKFTDTSWNKVVLSFKEWSNLDGNELNVCQQYKDVFEGSKDDALPVYGYHSKCYSRFTDKTKIARATKRVALQSGGEKQTSVESQSTSRQGLRSAATKSSTTQAVHLRGHVLPAVCIFCKKVPLFYRSHNKNFCDKLMLAETKDGGRLREAATQKEDETILRHIRDKDCVAVEVRYHLRCYKEYVRFLTRKPTVQSAVSSEVSAYETTFNIFSEDVVRKRIILNKEILRMAKLLDVFIKMAKDIEHVDISNYRAFHLKKRLQSRFPQLVFHSSSKKFKSEMVFVDELTHGDILEQIPSSTDESSEVSTTETDTDAEPVNVNRYRDQNQLHTLYTAAMHLRQELDKTDGLTGPWPPTVKDLSAEAAKALIPIPLYNTVAWILGISDEPTLDNFVTVNESSKLTSIIQDLIYLQSHGKKQTPKSICLGMTVRHLSGSKIIIDLLNKFGHCSSHSTILRLDTTLAQLQLEKGNVYIPDGFQKKTNTVLIWDNIDFCEETMSGHGTTHHTNGIGIQCTTPVQQPSEVTDRVSMPRIPAPFKRALSTLVSHHRKKRQGPSAIEIDTEYLQLKTFSPVHRIQHLKDSAYLITRYFDDGRSSLPGWTGYNTLLTSPDNLLKSEIAYLPVIEASPTEMDTVNTILSRSIDMADKLELKTITVVFDLTIYAKAQEIRWTNDLYTERLIIRLGEFHTCMSFLSIIGKRFRDAGLLDVLVEAEVVASGSINSVLEGKQYNRAMNAHKMMFEALHRLRLKAFTDSLSEENSTKIERFVLHMTGSFPSPLFADLYFSDEFIDIVNEYEEFNKRQCAESKTFLLWSTYLDMVELLLSFIRATRESDWNLHIASIRSMLPWYFAYDKTHYARYLPVYWMEMLNLETSHNEAFNDLTKMGQWTVQRQINYGFSAIACDQTIEQTLNRDSKTSGGITGFTVNRNAVQRWILSQSQRAEIHNCCRLLAGIHQESSKDRKDLGQAQRKHGENSIGRLIDSIEQMINPFSPELSSEMVNINTGVVADEMVSSDLVNAHSFGEKALMCFFEERLNTDTVPFHAPIKQLKLKTFSTQLKVKTKAKSGNEIILQNDQKLFTRLLILSQHKQLDLKEVLSYSLGSVSYPLASSTGSLAKTNKSLLLQVLESKSDSLVVECVPINGAMLFDGMALLQSLPKQLPGTFGEVADLVLLQLLNTARYYKCTRIDFVIDRYPSISIKNAERDRRALKGSQMRQIYNKDQKIPQQWSSFLANGNNKTSLVEFLFSLWQNVDPVVLAEMDLFVAHGELCHKLCVVNNEIVTSQIDELTCDHEEADTRLLLHAKHASDSFYSTVLIKSPDTDVAIIILGSIEEITADIYFYTGVKNKSRILNMQLFYNTLGRGVCNALIGLHTFSGCDTTSCFHGKGKKKPYELINSNVFYLNVFSKLGHNFDLTENIISDLEKFVCELYGYDGSDINAVRYKMFCMNISSGHTLPPTRDALVLHARRANYQAAIHKRSTCQFIKAPSPDGYGWKVQDSEISIVWMMMDPAPSSILNYVHCKCKGKCDTKRCSCKSASVSCTDLCSCGSCENTEKTLSEHEHDYFSPDEDE